MAYKKLPFWERNVNPITGWRTERTDRSIGKKKLSEEVRISKSLKSYGRNS
tara:strand:+ start:1893 stop:2045 length:153 start_codon:yes stop_codon:yes gene_type:complete